VIRRLVALLLTVGLVTASGAPAGAADKAAKDTARQRKEQIKQQISSLRDEVAEASAEESKLLGQLDEVQGRRADLDGRIAEIDGQIDSVQRAVDSAAVRFDQLTNDLTRTELKLDVAMDQERASRDELRERAVNAYIHRPELSAAEVILHAKSMRELAAGRGYYQAVVAQQRHVVDRYTDLKDATQALRESVATKREEAKAQQDVIIEQRKKLESARYEQDSVRQEVQAEEAQHQTLLDEVERRKAEFQAEIAALQAESSGITSLLQGVQSGQVAVAPGNGRLAMPIPGARVSSLFGPRMHPIFHEMRNHTGIDLAASAGTPIRAAADGVVVFAGPRGGYGNATIIDHGDSLATLSAHQSAIYVGDGQRVTRGQVIGAVGCTGFCTGPHLHFEVRVNGTPVNPLPYL
jgi:murein DD-endopeptidase MepM/ murein hydrolase activator NlpD